MIALFAVRPQRGSVVHLHGPSYRPSAKPRGVDRVALCGAPVWPSSHDTPFEDTLSQLADAVRWTSMEPSPTDPRPAWRWCRSCTGHALDLAGLVTEFLIAAAERQPKSTSSPP
ncbi:hypothetical protein ACFORH_42725 [Amycolatopsis roodepoortensis]|uniref:Uncharacterized protein n=1 Tax=Amycolatopsis roodepoortensis TaxID=700274 RepID=A0ABR9L2S3_9PSEU|nr:MULTISPECIES: hypothetical protein [Amycolatopsis]MBE1575041.1 hypothetical protein [Amycolatopsis roodepoortensis]GHG97342.1 hypothetical protein GCM10017788_76780 [Amycolatopsis acidiphila]